MLRYPYTSFKLILLLFVLIIIIDLAAYPVSSESDRRVYGNLIGSITKKIISVWTMFLMLGTRDENQLSARQERERNVYCS